MTLELDAAKTAFVVIDLQTVIVSMSGPHGPPAVANCDAIARALRARRGLVVWVRVGFRPDFADALRRPADQPAARPEGGLPPEWMTFDPSLTIDPADHQLTKHQWGAVHGTDLELQLRRRGIETVIMGGISTNFGVESTARDLWELNYAMVFAEDAMASRTPEMHRFPVENIFPRMGLVRPTAQVLAALG
jgi:nicotinamidase-related amidase